MKTITNLVADVVVNNKRSGDAADCSREHNSHCIQEAAPVQRKGIRALRDCYQEETVNTLTDTWGMMSGETRFIRS